MRPIFSLAISHTPWIPERVESMKRLRDQLGFVKEYVSGPGDETPRETWRVTPAKAYLEMTEKAANHEWSGKMWKWASEQKVTHCLFLQDDVVVAPNFWAALDAMVSAVPNEVIALEAVHKTGPLICKAGGHWYTTTDGLIGVGYVIPIAKLQMFLRWRDTQLVDGAVENITEDTLINVWLMATSQKAWHPTPTIIDHDVSLNSTYGNDYHENRRPTCTWEHWKKMGGHVEQLESIEFWICDIAPPHVGRFYQVSHQIFARAVKGDTAARVKELERDIGDEGISRGMRVPSSSGLRVVIATPCYGPDVSTLYSTSIFRLGVAVRDADFSMLLEYDGQGKKVHMGHTIDHQWYFGNDLVRARSRAVRRFLLTDATHMLFIDSDVSFQIAAIAGLVSSGFDFVGCPYPRKNIDWNRARRAAKQGLDPERFASDFPYRLEKNVEPQGAFVEVKALGLGCTLLSRRCLETMVEAYRSELAYADDHEYDAETVALFQLMLIENEVGASGSVGRRLLSEDYSFCERWRRLGGKIMMYGGPGSPVDHVGSWVFKGYTESLIVPEAK